MTIPVVRRFLAFSVLLLLVTAAFARAQEPRPAPVDTMRMPADTLAPADTAQLRADTLAPADTTETLEELERRLTEELGRADTAYAQPAVQPTGQTRSALNPDLSAIGDFLADFSPDQATLEGGDRFQMREVEVGLQGAVDPYFRFDVFLGFHPEEIEVEEAYATTLSLPANLQAKLGKFHLPFGKVNLTHRPELHTIDYPLYLQEYFGEEGLSSTGAWVSVIGAPLGFYQEISVVATNGAAAHAHGEEEAPAAEGLVVAQEEGEGGKDLLDDLTDRLFVGHFKNSIDLSEAANLELGGSIATSDDAEEGRTSFYGIDATYRWKPPQLAKYRSAILQAEIGWRDAEEGDTRLGAFAFGQWQLTRRAYIGTRFDYVEPPEEEGIPSIVGGQAILRYFPTEFSQLRLVYERQDFDLPDEDPVDRLLFQATFALGPHRPHAF